MKTKILRIAVLLLLLVPLVFAAGCIGQGEQTTIRSSTEASEKVTDIGDKVSDISNVVEDVDKSLG